jgi:hypothetical protein
MKRNPLQIITLLGAIVALLILLANQSCTSNASSGNRPAFTTHRAKVLENNTITFVRIPDYLSKVYGYGDTVWVDMAKHVIDDTSDITMQCVIEPDVAYDYFLEVNGTDTTNYYTIYDENHNSIGTVDSHRLDSLINADNL